jgi:hypothetical protein
MNLDGTNKTLLATVRKLSAEFREFETPLGLIGTLKPMIFGLLIMDLTDWVKTSHQTN